MTKPYQCIAADPPWNETGGGKCKRGADKFYPLMKTKDIIELMQELICVRTIDHDVSDNPSMGSVREVIQPRFSVADNAHLWLFVTNNHLPDGLEVMDALGFHYISNVALIKAKQRLLKFQGNTEPSAFGSRQQLLRIPDGTGPSAFGWSPQRPGLGQYLAGQHELLLFGRKHKQKGVLIQSALWKDKESGAKRQGTLVLAPRGKHSEKPQAAYDKIENISPGPRLELFARGARPGWDVWGDEAPEPKEPEKGPCDEPNTHPQGSEKESK